MEKQQSPGLNQNLILVLIILQFFFSAYLFMKINSLAKAQTGTGTPQAAANNPNTLVPSGEQAQNLDAMPPIGKTDRVRGNKNAGVILVTYSDLECPFCKSFHATLNQVMEEYGDRVGLVYRHYPLSFHPKAQKAAEGAECAGELGGDQAYWAYIDTIFERMPDIEVSQFGEAATTAGVDTAAFQECLDSGKFAQKVKDDMDGGSAAGVSGTPGTILVARDGRKDFLGGAYPIEDVKAKIDTLLK
ncbi:MAG: DsbA family protein [Patescibacteria group bacterium]|nr:DsbA family protein [Patescibacteria group bacterium]